MANDDIGKLNDLAENMERVLALTEPLYLQLDPAARKPLGEARRLVCEASSTAARMADRFAAEDKR